MQASVQYALEGSIAVAGVGVRWLRDNLGVIKSPEESEDLARSVPDTAGLTAARLAFSKRFLPRSAASREARLLRTKPVWRLTPIFTSTCHVPHPQACILCQRSTAC